ncbi:signal transduction histidine kinase [Marmoricola sp. OAE513]|uniref:MacS family sensor histidine kinase n=1 Tax=Marmoricola sp. OAE513 TaxID=2817894 RepID=UPI001AE57002
MSTPQSPAAAAVEDRLFAALAVLRVIVLANAVGLNIYRYETFEGHLDAAVCVAVMIVWSGIATWAYRSPRRRTAPLLVVDLALAVGLLLATYWIKGPEFRTTMPSSWIVAALLAWAIHYRLRGGLVAGVVLAAADLSLRADLRNSDYGNAFLLILSGTIVGYLCASLQQMAVEREVAERAAAAAEERARLARVVHDGVLQVLALVQRRGRELGGAAAELGELAGEQERELRRLIRVQDSTTGTASTVDLTSELAKLEALPGVTVSTPGVPVLLRGAVASELVAAVRACLDNVQRHVGEGAPAWVLLQASPTSVEVSVRDDGPGIPAGRLAAAAEDGRLGVAESIQGRIAALGGTAELSTGSFGTEWEFTVPRTLGSAT